MKNFILKIAVIIGLFAINIFAKNIDSIKNSDWETLHLYHGENQKAGPFAFDDTYVEFEFGGRYEWLDLYGYVDFIDALNSKSSDKHGGNNFFVDIEPRISIDYLTNTDLSYGTLQELFLAFDFYYADEPTGKGLKIVWLGLGSDINLPWLGISGVNFYTRYIDENYGASNENSFDGYVAHINWFKPLYNFTDSRFLAFQGYLDYEFGSNLDNNSFEQQYRTSDSLQSYLGLWLHDKKWTAGYGLKIYKDMTQWKDGEVLNNKETKTSGFAHYFNVGYKF